MKSHLRTLLRMLAVAWIAATALTAASAHADIDLEAAVVGGTGFSKGKIDRPYAGVLGVDAALIVEGIYLGVRWTRSFGSSSGTCVSCTRIGNITNLGLDVGYEWELWLLHLGPKFGVGWIRELGAEPDVTGSYIDPGLAAELEFGWFVVGADIRYRFVRKEKAANGLLLFGRAGLRF